MQCIYLQVPYFEVYATNFKLIEFNFMFCNQFRMFEFLGKSSTGASFRGVTVSHFWELSLLPLQNGRVSFWGVGLLQTHWKTVSLRFSQLIIIK